MFTPFPRSGIEQSLVARFRSQVAQHGARTAVATPYETWTYNELNARANGFATTILERCGPGSEPIALCLDQSATLVAAVLGVLKAGKFYVPFDPDDRSGRQSEILRAVGTPFVIDGDVHADPQANEPPVVVDPADPAYVFFTSGTTGAPKGVVDSHRNVLHNVYRYTNALGIGPDDRLTVIQAPSFSGTVSSIFCALLNGATLLPFSFRSHGFTALANWLRDSRATIYHSVPSIFRGVVEAGGHFPDIRIVRLEGDGAGRVDHELFQRAFRIDGLLAHGLGATETGLSCQLRATRETVWTGERLPVGYPLPDMEVRIVDEAGTEVAAGATGEIEISSEFLATGYWKDPEQTRGRFVLAGDQSRRRRYRTGDLGTIGVDGAVYHLGRVGQEQRINGQWVPTGEVERELRAIGDFHDLLVTTRADDRGEPRLVAYVVVADHVEADPGRWRDLLSERLPAHMLPSFFVPLDALPLGEHGKVDRAALPDPHPIKRPAAGRPASETERDMVACWQEVLGVEPIGTHDNFFELGGDSLRAALLVARVERTFGRRLAPEVIASAPTVSALLARVQDTAATGGSDALVALQSLGSRPPLFCIEWPGAVGWQLAPLAHRLGRDQPVYCVLGGGIPEPWPSGTRIEHLADATIRHIRSIQASGPIRLAGNCYGAVIALEVARRLNQQRDPVALLAMLAISPRDFPSLVSADAATGYDRQGKEARVTRMERAWRRLKRVAARLLGRTLDEPSRRTVIARLKALSAYEPQRHPGEVLLVLSEDTARAYAADPAACWAALAERVTLRLVPGVEDDFYAEPAITHLAHALGQALQLPASGVQAVFPKL